MERINDEGSSSSRTADDDNILHNLIFEDEPDDVMARMNTQEGREELRRKDENGRLPLHSACEWDVPLELVEAMLGEYPESVRATDNYDRLPLHSACSNGYSVGISPQVVRLILDAYPEGVRASSTDGGLPLHAAALFVAPLEVLRMLMDASPEAVATPDYHGRLPVHVLAPNASPDKRDDVEKVEVLLRPLLDNDEARHLPDPLSRGETPMHIGARFDLLGLHACLRMPRCPGDAIVMVAERHLEQLRERSEDGSLPLHLAAANPNLNGAQDRQEDVIAKLVRLYPDAAATSDGNGRSPLNLAIESGKRWNEGVEAIADAAKGVRTIRDVGTNLFPFMLAASQANPCITSVYELLRCCPDICKKP